MVTSLSDTTRAIDALSTPYALALARWARAFAAAEMRRATADPRGYVAITKQDKPPRGSFDELRRLLLLFGLRRGKDAANEAAESRVVPGSIVADAVAGKPVKIVLFQQWIDGATARAESISEGLRERIRESVRVLVAEADAEPTKVAVGELARRISRQVHAVEPAGGGVEGRAYLFSAARAEVIARTELAQVENTARVAGYEATGIEEIEWLAYSDGRSGDRHHERMRGQRIAVGAYFTTPQGNRLRYPGDPLGPISETAQCRCTIRPVRQRRNAAASAR